MRSDGQRNRRRRGSAAGRAGAGSRSSRLLRLAAASRIGWRRSIPVAGRRAGRLVPDRLDLGLAATRSPRPCRGPASVCHRVGTCRPSRRGRGSRCSAGMNDSKLGLSANWMLSMATCQSGFWVKVCVLARVEEGRLVRRSGRACRRRPEQVRGRVAEEVGQDLERLVGCLVSFRIRNVSALNAEVSAVVGGDRRHVPVALEPFEPVGRPQEVLAHRDVAGEERVVRRG